MSAVTPRRPPVAEPAPRRAEPAPAPTEAVARRRRLLALASLGVVLAVVSAGWLILSASGEPPPATGAATIVPADALAYVSLSTDPSRPAVTRARALAARFPAWPLLEAAALKRMRTVIGGGSGSAAYAAQIRSWLGNEAALALLPSSLTGSAAPLVVLEVAQRPRAQAFVRAAGAMPAGRYDGTRLLAYRTGTELAFVGHYLVAGADASVRAALDAARGRVAALVHNGAHERAVAGEPDDRVLDAYLTAAGIRRLLAPRPGVAGALGQLLTRPGLEGAAVSVAARPGGARVLVHSVLGAGAARSRSFTPTLQSVLPPGSALMLDVPSLDRVAPNLLRATAIAGIAGNVGPLLARVGGALTTQGVNVRKVVSLFDGESAVALAPGPAPALLIVARVHDQAAARSELAALEGPVTALFSPSGSAGGQVPELADAVVGDATIHEVRLGPGLQLDYGVFDGLVVISTSVQAIEDVARRSRSLADDATYKAALPDQPAQLSSLVFGDFTQLLRLGEQTGLESGALTRELLPDLSKVRAIGLSSTSGERDTTTELNLDIP